MPAIGNIYAVPSPLVGKVGTCAHDRKRRGPTGGRDRRPGISGDRRRGSRVGGVQNELNAIDRNAPVASTDGRSIPIEFDCSTRSAQRLHVVETNEIGQSSGV